MKFNEENHGLSNSIIRGINKVLERNDKIIVLEDDILCKIFTLHESFLNTFENSKNVWYIGGWQYPIGFSKSGLNFYFIDL